MKIRVAHGREIAQMARAARLPTMFARVIKEADLADAELKFFCNVGSIAGRLGGMTIVVDQRPRRSHALPPARPTVGTAGSGVRSRARMVGAWTPRNKAMAAEDA